MLGNGIPTDTRPLTFDSWSTLVSRCCLTHLILHWTPIIQWTRYARVRGLLQLFIRMHNHNSRAL